MTTNRNDREKIGANETSTESNQEVEEALRGDEEQYRMLFETMTEGFSLDEIIWDVDGNACDLRYLMVNPAFEVQTGLKAEGIIGRTALELFPAAEPVWFERYGQVVLTGEAMHFEEEFGPLGRWFEVTAFKVDDHRFATLFMDITVRKQAAEERERLLAEVQAEREKLAALVNSIQDEVWFSDTSGTYTLVNRAAVQEFALVDGKEIDLEQLATSMEILKPDGTPRPIDDSPSLRALNGEIISNEEDIIRTPATGELRYRQINASPVRDGENNIIGSVSVVRDITEQKRVAEEREQLLADVQAEREKLAALVNSIQDEVWFSDTSGTYILENPAALREFALSANENIEIEKLVSNLEILRPDGTPRPLEETPPLRALKGEIVTREESIAHTPASGELRYRQVSAAPVRDGTSKIIGAVSVVHDITDLKLLEKDLRRANEELEERVSQRSEQVINERQRLFTVLETLPAMICLLTPDYHVAFANHAFREKFGESGGQHCYEYCFNHSEPCEFCESYTVLETGQPHHWEVTASDGSSVIDTYDYPFTDIDGSPLILEMDMDITEQRRAENQLKSASLYARNLIEASLDPLVTISPEGKIMDVNRATEQVTGVPREELIGTDFSDYFTEPEKAKEGYQQVFSEGFVKDYPLAIRDKDGKVTDVLYNAAIYQNAEGEVQGVFADARDVTQHRKDEQRIRQQAELLDNAHDAITLRDLDNRLLYCNKGNERLYGWKAEEILGKIAHEVFFVGPSERPLEALRLVKERGEWSGEMHHVDRDGKEIIVESRWTLMRDAGGNPESILVINTDITDKKKIEAQFLRSQRMENIGDLAGGIAHDLNNILTPILLSVDVFKAKLGDDEESLSFLEMLEANIKRGSDLTKQILSFARGVEGERQPVQISRVVTEIAKTIKETFPRSIEISTEIPEEPWNVIGDMTQIHQVVMNLCLNARDAMPFGGTLHVDVENVLLDETYARMNIEAKVGPYVVISVVDSGSGISPGVMDHLFEPFFTTKNQGKGTGLGLATALGIVKNHGGFINVYSEVGKGSTFKVYLPSSPIGETKAVEQTPEEQVQGQGELILVVDDEKVIRDVATTILNKNGYTTTTASDGAEAVAMFAQQRNDIAAVILDMMMPIMDGYACIKALRKIDPAVKIIGVSGLGQNGKHHEIENSANGFLVKPFTAEKLLRLLRGVLTQ